MQPAHIPPVLPSVPAAALNITPIIPAAPQSTTSSNLDDIFSFGSTTSNTTTVSLLLQVIQQLLVRFEFAFNKLCSKVVVIQWEDVLHEYKLD